MVLYNSAEDISRAQVNALTMWLAVLCSMLLALVLLLLAYAVRSNRDAERANSGEGWGWRDLFGDSSGPDGESRERRSELQRRLADDDDAEGDDIDAQLAVSGAAGQYNAL